MTSLRHRRHRLHWQVGHGAQRRRWLDASRPTEDRDQLAPKARPADAVEQEVDGIVGVGDQVDERPGDLETRERQHVGVSVQLVAHDEVERDGRGGEEEGEGYRDEDDGHARDLALRVKAVLVQIADVGHLDEDRHVAGDEDGKWDEREEREVEPGPHASPEVLVARVERHAVDAVLVDVTQLVRPEEVEVEGSEQHPGDHQADGGAGPREQHVGHVRQEDGDETLDGDDDEDPSLELSERVHEKDVQLAADAREGTNVGAVQVLQPLAQEAGEEDKCVDEGEHGQVEGCRALPQPLPQHHDGRQRVADGAEYHQDGGPVQPQRLGQPLVGQVLVAQTGRVVDIAVVVVHLRRVP